MPETPIFQGFFTIQASKPALNAGLAPSTVLKTLPRVALETLLGTLTLENDTAAPPITAFGFLSNWAYDGGPYYRAVTPENRPDRGIGTRL